MTDPTDPKTCNTCGITKTAADFYRHASASDGLRGNCKACHIAASRAYYWAHRDEILPRHRAYAKATNPLRRKRERRNRERNREQIRAYHKAWRDANREHVRAEARNAYRRRKAAAAQAAPQGIGA